MTDEASRVLDAALQLPAIERAELAAILADGVGEESSPEEIEASWIAEAKRRSEAIERGELGLIDSDEVMAKLRARIERARMQRVG